MQKNKKAMPKRRGHIWESLEFKPKLTQGISEKMIKSDANISLTFRLKKLYIFISFLYSLKNSYQILWKKYFDSGFQNFK